MRKSSHRKALETIAANPSRFGFEDIIATAIEMNLYNRRKRLVAQPDIVLWGKSNNLYIVEYKSNGDISEIQRAQQQLSIAKDWFEKQGFQSNLIKVYILDGRTYKAILNEKKRRRRYKK